MNFDEFSEKLDGILKVKPENGNRLRQKTKETKDFRIALGKILKKCFGASGYWRKRTGRWHEIFEDVKKRTEVTWHGNESEFVHNLSTNGQGNLRLSYAFYYWLHTYSYIEKGRKYFPFKSMALTLDEKVFKKHLIFLESSEYKVNSIHPPESSTHNVLFSRNGIKIVDKPCTIIPAIPKHKARKRVQNPASILKWDNRLTKLIGRNNKFHALNSWWHDTYDYPISCMVVVGAGGVGKTRIAIEFAEKVCDENWTADFIKLSSLVDNEIWMCGKEGVLIIIDNPEDQAVYLQGFLDSLNNLKTFNKKIRILLLGRNKAFLESLSFSAQLFFDEPLHLGQLENALDDHWELFQSAWWQIVNDADISVKQNCPPIDREAFEKWMSNNSQQTPLFTLSLALYLAKNSNFNETEFFHDISDENIVRYLVKTEMNLIQTEVQNINKTNNYVDKQISVSGVVLLKALSAIARGLSANDIRQLISELKAYPDLVVMLPALNELKNLSVWEKGLISPIEPDILAADFLSLALERYADGIEEFLIISALGVFNGVLARDIVIERFSNLSRLMYDTMIKSSSARADWKWPIERIVTHLCSRVDTCFWISDNLYSPRGEIYLKPLLIQALDICLQQPLTLEKKAEYTNALAVSLFNTKHDRYGVALEYARKAVSLYTDLFSEDKSRYRENYALSLLNLAIHLIWSNQIDEALSVVIKATKEYRYLVEQSFLKYACYLSSCLTNRFICISKKGGFTKSDFIMDEAVNIMKELFLQSGLREADLAFSLYYKSKAHRYVLETKEALLSAEEALTIYTKLSETEPRKHDVYWVECMIEVAHCLAINNDYPRALKQLSIATRLYNRLCTESDIVVPEYKALVLNVLNVLRERYEEEHLASIIVLIK